MENNTDAQYKYKITTKKPVGKGSFATVYRAISKENEEVAIKCIHIEKIHANNAEKFLLELDISMKMKHINIVKCREVFKTKKGWYIVCEYCDGGTLGDIIKSPLLNKFNREMICKRYLTQLKNALKYIYRNNIIHRDLKPSNILITGKYPNDVLKLADFGFSRYFINNNNNNNNNKEEENNFLMTSFCGTPMYMAPEILGNNKYSNKVDLWSFGIIMYEMLYDKNPYSNSKNLIELFEKISKNDVEFGGDYSDECINLLKKLLQIDPKKRIDWESFFKNKWFDKTIPSGFSMESLVGSSENIYDSPSSPVKNNEISETYDLNENYKIDHQIRCDCVSDDNVDCEDDFEIIDKDDIKACDYKEYKEEEMGGYIKILSNSIYNSFCNMIWK